MTRNGKWSIEALKSNGKKSGSILARKFFKFFTEIIPEPRAYIWPCSSTTFRHLSITNKSYYFSLISGYITLDEFSDACNLLSEHMPEPIPQEQLLDICRSMDINKDGQVDLNEFLETFRLVDIHHHEQESPTGDHYDTSPDDGTPKN